MEKAKFTVSDDYGYGSYYDLSKWDFYGSEGSDPDDEMISYLAEYASYFGIDEDDICLLLNEGYDEFDIEELLYDPLTLQQVVEGLRKYGEFFARNQIKANLHFEKESDLFYVDEECSFGYRSFELVPYGSGHHSVTLDFEKIFACSFPAICRLFVTNYHHFSQNVENELMELCRTSKDAAKYNKRENIFISEKTSFCLYNV